MKLLVCCMFLVASTQAFSIARERDANARILRSDNDIYPDGSYQYGYEADNGIEVEESGVAGVSVSGSAKWVDNDGTPIELTYTADENGYHPQGAHLPVAPPIPDYILRALAYIESHPNKNDPYAYVHQPDPVYETKVYTPKPVKSTYQAFAKPQVYRSPFATTSRPQTYRQPVANRGRYNF
ncbi:hypothetical protein HA402_008368 [Bradysia odoriphaga]|nr:hypothetical protein HA402_008368 [Bradysia odoriphaga]